MTKGVKYDFMRDNLPFNFLVALFSIFYAVATSAQIVQRDSFGYSIAQNEYVYQIPDRTDSLRIILRGGDGASNSNSGAVYAATFINVRPGQLLDVIIGSEGNRFGTHNGGGATAVLPHDSISLANVDDHIFIVAGGGGGAGTARFQQIGDPGGFGFGGAGRSNDGQISGLGGIGSGAVGTRGGAGILGPLPVTGGAGGSGLGAGGGAGSSVEPSLVIGIVEIGTGGMPYDSSGYGFGDGGTRTNGGFFAAGDGGGGGGGYGGGGGGAYIGYLGFATNVVGGGGGGGSYIAQNNSRNYYMCNSNDILCAPPSMSTHVNIFDGCAIIYAYIRPADIPIVDSWGLIILMLLLLILMIVVLRESKVSPMQFPY